MATHLQQLLQSLCWNTEWDYAVFWKLNHHAPMVLTCDDAYYKNNFKHDASESKISSEALESLHDGHLGHDPLGLAVAKLSYHVYSLGEGIVGQVAVSGKHQWIFAADYMADPCLPPEICDGWQAQFASGVKTIVVAAVVPHGVVQLGSLNEVKEDFKLLVRIRDLFSSLQDSSTFHVQNPMDCNMQSVLQMSDTPASTFNPDLLSEYILNVDRDACVSSPIIPPLAKQSNDSYGTVLPGVYLDEAMILQERNELQEVIDNVNLIQPVSGIQNTGTSTGQQVCLSSQSCLTTNNTSYDVKLPAEKSRVKSKDSPTLNPSVLNVEDFLPGFDCLDSMDELQASLMFSGGSELHEALGLPFAQKTPHLPWEAEKLEVGSSSHMPQITENSLLTTSDLSSNHLLEAVVANFCHKDVNAKTAVSFSTSESMLTTEKMPEPSIKTSPSFGSSYYSVGSSSLLEGSMRQSCLNSSDLCSVRSSTSACKNTYLRPTEPRKTSKKRARPGENPRPRPRDRQLIQDRLKELRELVPNGSKCSIDSLLERTIKHMAFMQSVTKHADKLSNCAKSRGCSKETVGSGNEQGSCWAVEVGGQMKICPIVVENLNMKGQMLIEMLCEDCVHFLEIAEVIKSLGLTVLKGMTDYHGEKTWMRFVVEGQSNRNLHRMEVLWSLVQILQSKATA